jgi:hypothetical protein
VKYRYDKKTGKMVEITHTVSGPRTSPHIIDDIEPYRVVGPEQGKLITSRSKHREYLRKHNLIEVGNERKYFDGTPK